MARKYNKRVDSKGKIDALRRHMVKKVPVSEICEELGVQKLRNDQRKAIIEKCLNMGADINARQASNNYTPLMVAIDNLEEDMVKFLLTKSNVKIHSKHFQNLYWKRCKSGMLKIQKQTQLSLAKRKVKKVANDKDWEAKAKRILKIVEDAYNSCAS